VRRFDEATGELEIWSDADGEVDILAARGVGAGGTKTGTGPPRRTLRTLPVPGSTGSRSPEPSPATVRVNAPPWRVVVAGLHPGA
jgi:hypothetical protein